jgi:hypothetical protein
VSFSIKTVFIPSFGIVSSPFRELENITNWFLAQELSLAQDVDLERSQGEDDLKA